MKLLLDENLSRRLVPALQARFPGTSEVALLGLERATDAQVAARGYRPKLVQVALGNAGNEAVLAAILAAADRLEAALAEPGVGVVVLG